MSTAPKKTAAAKKAVPTAKPKAPAVVVKSDAPDAGSYRVTGRILRNGEVLRPGDTVELTDAEAFGLRGFIEPTDPVDVDEGGEAESPAE